MDGTVGEHINQAIPARINVDALTSEVSVTTPDYRHIVTIQQRLRQFAPSLLHVELGTDRQSARIVRIGRGQARWELPA